MNTAPEFDNREMACAVCGSESRTHLGWRGGAAHHDRRGIPTAIVRCNECTHLYPHPMPFPAGSLSNLYDDPDNYFSEHDVEHKKRVGGELMGAFERKLGHRGRFLDVGCGRGELLWAAREAGWEVEGVDPSSAHLEWGRLNLGIEGRLATVEEANFPEDHFDAITMGGVIEHLYDPHSVLREVWRVLKPGGFFYFDAPNEDSLYMRIGNLYLRVQRRDWVVNLAPTFPPYHVQGFNPVSLRRLLERVGFELEELGVCGEISPLTGKTSLRKRLEYRAGQFINWVGNRRGEGIYMVVWTRKPD
ncbi:MAG: class I SAM-dependent methyltransferase [Pyrinomonadaceae bacterium]|nr:class I SAM-dependent methyltransferase [Pyrinomonadaceae bacterium]